MTGPSGGVLLNPAQSKLNGGQKYALRLRTADGDEHFVVYDIGMPMKNGAPDLTAAAEMGKNPKAVGLRGIIQSVAQGQAAALAAALGRNPGAASPAIDVEGGDIVFVAHIVSARYLGEVTAHDERRRTIDVVAPDGTRNRYDYNELNDILNTSTD